MKRIFIFALLGMTLANAAFAQWSWTPQTGRWINLKNLPKETPELQLEFARDLLIQGEYNKALRETTKFEKFYADSDFSDDNQFLRAEIRQAQGDLMNASRAFQQVVDSYPSTNLYDQAMAKQYEIGDALYEEGLIKMDKRFKLFKKRPMKRAVEVYSIVVENQPFTAVAAEAQYKLGLCNFTLENYTEAAFEYRRVIEDYAGSDWVDEASYGLAITYIEQSLPPAYDQSPSALALEAIDRFVNIYSGDERIPEMLEHRNELHQRIAAQRLLNAQFYEKRRKFTAAQIYYEEVVKQFPGTPAAETAQAWLDEHSGIPRPGFRMAQQDN